MLLILKEPSQSLDCIAYNFDWQFFKLLQKSGEHYKSNLEKSKRKKIIILGMETHVCVFQTVRDLLIDNYEVFVLSDGVASRTRENYENGLDMMKTMGAVITNSEMAVFDLLKKAGTDEFKTMSKLIK